MKYLATVLNGDTLVTIYADGNDVIYVCRFSNGDLIKRTEHLKPSAVPILALAFQFLFFICEPGSHTRLIHGVAGCEQAFASAADAVTMLVTD